MDTRQMPTEGQTDADTIRASVADPARFGLIFDRHVDAIYGYLCRRVGTGSAEELTSETFVLAFDRRDRFSGGDARPWLYGIATNLIRHHLRAERRRLAAYARAASAGMPEPEVVSIEDRLDAEAVAPILAAALQQLEQGDRDVLLLHAWQGLSYKEVGAALDIAVGTVGSRLSRARRMVRALLGEDERFGRDGTDG